MNLPVNPPVSPMLAKLVREMPDGNHLYEPKWDGFRCIVFRDDDQVVLQSRNGKPLERYFPEMLDPIRSLLPDRCVVDGELVVPIDGGIEFDAISERIHPAESRITNLSRSTPARFIAFDLLAVADQDLMSVPLRERRARLEALSSWPGPIHITPATLDPAVATDWFNRFEGAGLDGVVAKPLDGHYTPGKRTLAKVKHERTVDVVVAGFRWHKDSTVADPQVGSLLLGLYDNDIRLHHIGVASSFSASRRRELAAELGDLPRPSDRDDHPWLAWSDSDESPRGGNRWNAAKDMSFELIPLRVAEVAYEQLSGDRLRHSARFKHWRVDREPDSCTYEQVEVAAPAELRHVLAAS